MRKEEEQKGLRIAFVGINMRIKTADMAFRQFTYENINEIEHADFRKNWSKLASVRFRDGTVAELVNPDYMLLGLPEKAKYDQIIVAYRCRFNDEALLNSVEVEWLRQRICNEEVPEDFVIQKFEME